MKNILERLSPEQETELGALIKEIVERFRPEQIYCFGYRINSSACYSCFSEDVAKTTMDYDLLVITESAIENETEIQKLTTQSFKSGTITLVNFSQKIVLASLAVGQNFINTIIKKGFLLFTKEDEPYNKENLAERAIDLNRAKICFERSFTTAWNFIDAAADRFINEDYNLMGFMLHQALESACRGTIKLFLGFYGNKKNLKVLFGLTNNVASHLMPFQQYEQNNKVVKQLQKSYDCAKINSDYTPEKDMITNLQTLTESLIEAVENYGKQHLDKLISKTYK